MAQIIPQVRPKYDQIISKYQKIDFEEAGG
jgi:hypothetical protein